MIYFGTISNISKEQFKKNILIVRSLNKTMPAYVTQEKDLAPSSRTFGEAYKSKQEGTFNQEYFDKVFTQNFLNDLSNNPTARDKMISLLTLGQTEDILLACFCPNEKLCHRSIVKSEMIKLAKELNIKGSIA